MCKIFLLYTFFSFNFALSNMLRCLVKNELFCNMHRVVRKCTKSSNYIHVCISESTFFCFFTQVLRMPKVPTCNISSDRFSNAYLLICVVVILLMLSVLQSLEERGSLCHICREVFTSSAKLFY